MSISMLSLMQYISRLTHSQPKANRRFFWGSCWVEIFSQFLSFTYPWAQDWKWWELCDAFDLFSSNFLSPWIICVKLSNGLLLTEGKKLEDFWVDIFPALFLLRGAAELVFISLREQNLRPEKKRFVIAVCCSINVHSFQKTWFLWNPSSLIWFGPEIWQPATFDFEKQLISWIHRKTGKAFYLHLHLREPLMGWILHSLGVYCENSFAPTTILCKCVLLCMQWS